MILIADGGSTKVDWIALDDTKKEVFRTRTKGLNPVILTEESLNNRLVQNTELTIIQNKVTAIFFYGAGCGTAKPTTLLKKVLKTVFINANVIVEEDMLAAVYAASSGKKAIVCILGTGSNSCYYDGEKAHQNVVSLGYILMDEASGNHFGKRLLVDYFYRTMPTEIAVKFEATYDLSADTIKQNLYQKESPNAYLGDFAAFMFEFKEHEYMHKIIAEGFITFFERRILPYKKSSHVPIYFIGSIAYFFESILQEVARKYELEIAGILRRPIDNLIAYHQGK